ncbi:hypothetical protein ERICIII_03421 [Paenibacillus larvae subsp. larvae]|uniref:Uncharacterized protein n=1 Tax=Paenibacillus larvae subsp. larvae TaxID=147375 RepID=A0A2L1U296_9BACL|nr:hypothetical protein ERICIII_02920 [Paenibacillus larvae subsp. larvae]AVF27531.1 hypothetical protein ERICIII_03421 [Paenibacillus larvae subsp. larvae]
MNLTVWNIFFSYGHHKAYGYSPNTQKKDHVWRTKRLRDLLFLRPRQKNHKCFKKKGDSQIMLAYFMLTSK